MLTGAAVGLACFAAFVIVHVILFHLREIRSRALIVLEIFAGAVGGCLIVSALALRRGGDLAPLLGDMLVANLSGALVMCALFVLYMPFYYTIATSLSVRTLITIQRTPANEISVSALKAKYVSMDLLRSRLEAMVQSGLLVRDGDGFRLSWKGKSIARVFRLIKLAWKLGPGG